MQMQINKEFRKKIKNDIYIGSDQKTLRSFINLLNIDFNSIIIIIRLQTNYKRVKD